MIRIVLKRLKKIKKRKKKTKNTHTNTHIFTNKETHIVGVVMVSLKEDIYVSLRI